MDRLNTVLGHCISVFADMDELIPAAAGFIQEKAEAAIHKKQFFTLVLSGGNTPKGLYRYLAENYNNVFPWEKTYFFWSDERCVASEDSRSNYRMAFDAMLGPVGVPEDNILRIKGEKGKEKGAQEYEHTIRNFASFEKGKPVFDLILLGMGSDGHTASLFPGSPVLDEKENLIQGVDAPAHIEPHVDRITMTLPVLKKAESLLFLVSGESKEASLRKIFNSNSIDLPAAAAEQAGNGFWYITKNCFKDETPNFP